MLLVDYIKICAININKRKLRFALSVLSISIGIASIIFIMTSGSSGLTSINKELSKMGLDCCVISSKNEPLDNNLITELQNSLYKNYYTSSIVKLPADIINRNIKYESILYGGDEETLKVFSYDIISGRNLSVYDLIKSSKVAIIDKNTSMDIFRKENSIGENLEIDISGIRETFKIIGITDCSAIKNGMENTIPPNIYIPHTAVDNLIGESLRKEIYTLSRTENKTSTDEVKSVVNVVNNNKTSNRELQIQDMNIYKTSINYVADTITLILALIAVISLISGGIGVINTMLITVYERRNEIGIKKALGQTNLSVINELITESVVTMIISCIIGIIFGVLLAYICMKIYEINFVMDLYSIMLIGAVSLFMGVLFALLPAIKAFRMNPVEILK